jgi:hypothetical protein
MIYRKGTWLLLVWLGVFLAFPAMASNELSLSPKGDGFLYAENIAPGMVVRRVLRVHNKGTETADLFLKVTRVEAALFASYLDWYVRDKESGKLLMGGYGDRFTLQSLSQAEDAFVDRLAADESKQLEISVRVNTALGNEFQGKTLSFDLRYALRAESGSKKKPPLRQGVSLGGTGVTSEEDFLKYTLQEDKGEVKGVEQSVVDITPPCRALLVWQQSLLVVIFAAGFLFGRKVEYAMGRRSSLWKGLWILSALVTWFELDECRSTLWMPCVLLLVALLLWQKRIKKKV